MEIANNTEASRNSTLFTLFRGESKGDIQFITDMENFLEQSTKPTTKREARKVVPCALKSTGESAGMLQTAVGYLHKNID